MSFGAGAEREISRRMVCEQASQRAFVGVTALLFAASAALTIVWCASMSAMGELSMPGGWTMSMAWMRMPGQTWPRGVVPWHVGRDDGDDDATTAAAGACPTPAEPARRPGGRGLLLCLDAVGRNHLRFRQRRRPYRAAVASRRTARTARRGGRAPRCGRRTGELLEGPTAR